MVIHYYCPKRLPIRLRSAKGKEIRFDSLLANAVHYYVRILTYPYKVLEFLRIHDGETSTGISHAIASNTALSAPLRLELTKNQPLGNKLVVDCGNVPIKEMDFLICNH